MMTNDDERGGGGVKNAQNLMTSYVNDPLVTNIKQKTTWVLLATLIITNRIYKF